MQDYPQQTMVISQRRSQTTYTEQATSRTKGNAADEAKGATIQARDRQEEARHFYQQKKSRDRRSRDDLQRHDQRHSCKIEALEKHVNMRTESLATTEADFFKTLLDRQEA